MSNRSWRYLVALGFLDQVPAREARALAVRDSFAPATDLVWAPRAAADDAPMVLIARSRLDPASPRGRKTNPLPDAVVQDRTQPGAGSRGRLWRDVRVTKIAVDDALAVADAHGRTQVASTLLAAGGLRTFPPSYVLLEMIRAWGCSPLRERVSLSVHVLDEEARHDIRGGRIDVARLIPLPGDDPLRPIEFWLEIATSAADPDRILVLDTPQRSILALLGEFGIAGPRWRATVEPAPCLGWTGWTLADIERWESMEHELLSVERFGVLHGSTMRLWETRAADVQV